MNKLSKTQLMRVDLRSENITKETLADKYAHLGGRALSAAILNDEVPPTCHPLGSRNKCILAAGLFAGTPFPCSGRLSIGAKSPLTGGIKESNVGGTAAWKMARLSMRGIIIEGSSPGNCWVLKIDKRGGTLLDCPEYQQTGTYELCAKIRKRFGKQVAAVVIGPAGELTLSAAGIAVTDLGGIPCDYAGRGGLGAVWGAKGLKAIVLDDSQVESRIHYSDRFTFHSIAKEFVARLKQSKKDLKVFGTAVEVLMSNELGYLPTRNYRFGQFEGVANISGEHMHKIIKQRGGKISKACMPGCPIHCSNLYVDADGQPLTGSLEYETIVMLGSNLGIRELDAIAQMDRFCDDCGLDTMEMGAALGVAVEAKLLAFGDAAAAINLLREIPQNTPLGRIIGNGAAVTGKVFGVARVPTVKGQGMAAYDPRSNKGIGVTYMSSPMGADHTAGCVMPGRKGFDSDKDYDVLQPEGQAELSLDLQLMVAVYDALGLCFFIGLGVEEFKTIVRLFNAKYGSNLTFDELVDIGRALLKKEHAFNSVAGISPVTPLPEFFEREALAPHMTRFDVDRETVRQHLQNVLLTEKNSERIE